MQTTHAMNYIGDYIGMRFELGDDMGTTFELGDKMGMTETT